MNTHAVSLVRTEFEIDGLKQSGLLIEPKEIDRSKKYPLVIHVHGHGNTGAWSSLASPLRFRYFNDEAVFFFPHQMGYGSEGVPDFCGPKTQEYIHRQVLGLLENRPWIDASRVYLLGVSRGAIVASMMLCRYSETYTRGVLIAGAYDLQADYEWPSKDPGVRANMETEMPLTDEGFSDRSAIAHAENIRAPIMIIHGERDTTISVEQARKFDARLTELRKDHTLIILPEDGHHVGTPTVFREHIWPFLGM